MMITAATARGLAQLTTQGVDEILLTKIMATILRESRKGKYWCILGSEDLLDQYTQREIESLGYHVRTLNQAIGYTGMVQYNKISWGD